MSDLVKRLRMDAVWDRLSFPDAESLSGDAADRLEALDAALRMAREGLSASFRDSDYEIVDAINDLLKD